MMSPVVTQSDVPENMTCCSFETFTYVILGVLLRPLEVLCHVVDLKEKRVHALRTIVTL